jgi:hypothetical protein
VSDLRLHVNDLMADVLIPRKTLLFTLKQSSSIRTKKENFAGMKRAFEFFWRWLDGAVCSEVFQEEDGAQALYITTFNPGTFILSYISFLHTFPFHTTEIRQIVILVCR